TQAQNNTCIPAESNKLSISNENADEHSRHFNVVAGRGHHLPGPQGRGSVTVADLSASVPVETLDSDGDQVSPVRGHPRRGRAVKTPRPPSNGTDFSSRPQSGKLWSPGENGLKTSPKAESRRSPAEDEPKLIKQPETRPISQEQLV